MHAVIFKNHAVGDLVPSLSAINNIIYSKKNTKVTVFLSERSEKFSFLMLASLPFLHLLLMTQELIHFLVFL